MRYFGVCAVAVATAIVGISSVAVQAEEKISGPYLGISGLGSSVSDVDFDNNRGANSVVNTADFDIGYGALLKGGYNYGSIRAEIELGYRKIDIGGVADKTAVSGDVDALTAMINGAWDIDTGTAVTPYLSLGAGIINVDGSVKYTGTNAESKSFDGTAPAGQVGVGIGYGLTSEIDLVGGYSFLAAPTGKTGQDEIIKIHSVQLGLNYNF